MHFSFFKYRLAFQGLFLGFSILIAASDAYCGKRKAQELQNEKEENGKEKTILTYKARRLGSSQPQQADEFNHYNDGIYSSLMAELKEGKKQADELADTFQSLADNGYAPAQHRLGKFYVKGKDNLPQEWTKGVEFLQKATQQGYTKAYTCLGQALWNERFDAQETLRLYEIAAAKGHVRAYYKIGQMYANGDFDADNTNNLAQALVWHWMGREYLPSLKRFKEYISLKSRILREEGEFSKLVDPLLATLEPIIARHRVEIDRNTEGNSPFSHNKLLHKHTHIYDYLERAKFILIGLKGAKPGFMVSAVQFNQISDFDIKNPDGISLYNMEKRLEKKKRLLTLGKENVSIQEDLLRYLDNVKDFNAVLKDFDKLISFHRAPLEEQRRKLNFAILQGQLLEDTLKLERDEDQELHSRYNELSSSITREKEAFKKIKEGFKPKIELLKKEKNQLDVMLQAIKCLLRGEGLKRRNHAFLKELGM